MQLAARELISDINVYVFSNIQILIDSFMSCNKKVAPLHLPRNGATYFALVAALGIEPSFPA